MGQEACDAFPWAGPSIALQRPCPRRSPAVREACLFNSGNPVPSSFWVQSGCSEFVE